MTTAERRYICQFLCDGEDHTLVLPRRSPLGTFDDPQNQPKGKWPITFLCLPHRHVCEVTLDTIHLDTVQTVAPGLNEVSLWQIEFECARENCGLLQTIYTRYSRDGKLSDVEGALRDASHVIACKGGHRAVVRWETLRVGQLG
jgi:hypothetical protein